MPRGPQLFVLAVLPIALFVVPRAYSQASEPTPPPAATAPASPSPTEPVAADAANAADAPKAEVAPVAGSFKGPLYVKQGKKEVYVGPKELISLTPTPMLDEEGKQRLDPDGKPMFNPPVKQQRDKHGNPAFEESGKPLFQTASALGYDDKGKKIHSEKVKPPKMTPISISRGTFTVDGVVGKAAMNYEISDLKFIYLYVPGMGVTVVSNHAFPGSKEQPKAFDGPTLTVKADDHTLQLSSDKRLLGKNPESAFVLVNREFQLPSHYPVVGYGETTRSPYTWPGSHVNQQIAGIEAPPVPTNLQPTLLMKACEKGEMRMPAPPVLPGQVAPPQPCVSIARAEAARKALSASTASVAATPAK